MSILPNCRPIGRVNICRWYILGSVGNSINNIAIEKQSGLTLPAPDATDSQEVAFITTSNQSLYEQLKASFTSSAVGGSASRLFVEPLYPQNQASNVRPQSPSAPYSPHNVITGFDTSGMAPNEAVHDEFNTLIRYAAFQDHDASQRWLCAIDRDTGHSSPECKNYGTLPESPITVYRVTKPPSGSDVLYTGTSLLYPRTVNQDETSVPEIKGRSVKSVDYNVVAQDLAQEIQKYMKARQNQQGQVSVYHAFSQWNAGPNCITRAIDCFEDTQDTAPYGVLPIGYLNETAGEITFAVGVNHTAQSLNNATYQSIGVYDGGSFSDKDILILEGIGSVTQTNPRVAGFDSCASPSNDPTKSNCLNGSALQVWRDLGSPVGRHLSLDFSTVSNLYVAVVARDTYCAAGGKGAALPFCSQLYRTAGYTVLPITPPAGTTNGNCDGKKDPNCGKYLPMEDLMGISERAYVVPGQLNGADASKIVYPYVVH
jgi:hypothetical protein